MTNKSDVPEFPLTMRRVEVLEGVVITRIFNLVMQWSGLTAKNVVDLYHESSTRVQECLDKLVKAQLLIAIPVWELADGTLVSLELPRVDPENPVVREFNMYYGSETGAIYAARRDGVLLKRIVNRIHEDIRGDHNNDRPKILHTLQLNEVSVTLSLGGFKPFAGYRGSVYVPGGEQLLPDALMWLRVEIGFPTDEDPDAVVQVDFKVLVEYERSATRAGAIRRKLRKHFEAAGQGIIIAVWFICETERAMNLFREEHWNLSRETGVTFPLFTCTYADVMAGMAQETMVNMSGQEVRIR